MTETTEKKGRRAEPMFWLAKVEDEDDTYVKAEGQPEEGFNRREKADKWLLANGEAGVDYYPWRLADDEPSGVEVETIRKAKLKRG